MGIPGPHTPGKMGTWVPIHLQLDPDLTLEKTKKVVRQKEAVKEQQLQLGLGTKKDPIVLDEVRRAPTQKGAARTPTTRGSQGTAKPQNPQCLRCGREHHQLRSALPKLPPVTSVTEKVTLALNASQRPRQHPHMKLVWTLPSWEQCHHIKTQHGQPPSY